jgi:methionine biosynthesis protein MetW
MLDTPQAARAMLSPDAAAMGLTVGRVDALRYDGHNDDPYEVAGMMRALMPQGVRVLDVGCGAGGVTLIANEGKGNDVHAIEPDPDRAAVACKRGIDVHTGILDMSYIAANNPFDVVMSSDVLEHLVSPAEMLDLFRRVLRPGGTVIVSVPNVAHWSVRANLLIGRFEYEALGIMDATHLRWFTSKSIVRLFEDAGFDVVSLRHTSGVNLPLYRNGLFRYMPHRLTAKGARLMRRVMPNLFGVQHILEARSRG